MTEIYPTRRDLNIEILEGRLTFRDGFRHMLESVHTPFDECVNVLKESESRLSFYPSSYELS